MPHIYHLTALPDYFHPLRPEQNPALRRHMRARHRSTERRIRWVRTDTGESIGTPLRSRQRDEREVKRRQKKLRATQHPLELQRAFQAHQPARQCTTPPPWLPPFEDMFDPWPAGACLEGATDRKEGGIVEIECCSKQEVTAEEIEMLRQIEQLMKEESKEDGQLMTE